MTELSERLSALGVTIESTFVEVTTRDKWLCFAWKVKLMCEGRSIECDYFTGTGNATGSKIERDNTVYWHGDRMSLGAAVVRGLVKPTPPEVADVVYSLRNPSALELDFEEWAPDYGYDPDSRKAHAIYLACQAEHRQLMRLLGPELDSVLGLEH